MEVGKWYAEGKRVYSDNEEIGGAFTEENALLMSKAPELVDCIKELSLWGESIVRVFAEELIETPHAKLFQKASDLIDSTMDSTKPNQSKPKEN